MDLIPIAAAVIGAVGAVIGAWIQSRRRQRKPALEEAADVVDPQRGYIGFLRQQLDERDEQLQECYRKRNSAEKEVARLRERERLRREDTA